MIRAIVLALILLAPSTARAQFVDESFFADVASGPGGAATGDIDLNGYDIDMEDGDIRNLDDLYPDAAMSSDAAPTPITVIGTKHPYPGIGAANNDGANLCVIPASGANDLTGVTAGNTAGDTLSFTTLDYDCEEAVTVLTEGIDYSCVAETDADCVVNIAATVNALAAALGLTAATVVGETTNFYPTVGTVAHLTVVSSDNVNTVILGGVGGQILVSRGSETSPAISTPGDQSTGIYWPEDDALVITIGGTEKFRFGAMTMVSKSHLDLGLYTIHSSVGALTIGYGVCNPPDVVGFPDTAQDFCAAGSGYIKGNLYAKDNVLIGNAPDTDAVPSDPLVAGPNAWAQATGANQTGGTICVAGGIGSHTIVCADRTISDQDEIKIIVEGVTTTLIESTDFDCEGTASEEVCCDNIGAAVVTAAIGLTPDCDTTAGTCYLTPDADLRSMGDTTVVDGGIDGVGFTFTNGAQGRTQIVGVTVGFGATTDQYPTWYSDGAAGVTLAGGATVTDAMDLAVTGSIKAGSLETLGINSRLKLKSGTDGKLVITNWARTGLTQISFGAQTPSYPAFYPDGAGGVTLGGADVAADPMDLVVMGTIKTEVVIGDVPTEPHACDAAHSGVIVTINDTNSGAYDQPCVCLNLDETGYDWRQLSDVVGTACVF